mgnify:CR=1 FL=1
MKSEEEQFVTLSGNTAYGPFPDPETAVQWVSRASMCKNAINMFMFERDRQLGDSGTTMKVVYSIISLVWPLRLV